MTDIARSSCGRIARLPADRSCPSAFLQNPTLASHIDVLIPPAWLQTLLLKALPVVMITFTLYVMYIFFPNTRVGNRPAMLGAS